jgi:signal peptidase II
MNSATAWRRVLLVGGATVAADQLTKALVRDGIERGDRQRFLPALDLVHIRNHGVAFGFLSDGGAAVTVITLVALTALLAYFVTRPGRPFLWLATGLLLGGAAGNLIDRAREGAVTDFLDLPLWPAFNLADVAITAGVLVLLLAIEEGAKGGP